MRVYTAADICRAINSLDRNRLYGYVSPRTHGEIQIVRVQLPEGPITIRRREIGKSWGVEESISSQMLWRLANALNTRIPVNVDRVFGGSYNTRSVLEALLAHTPEIYTCSPGRQETIGGIVSIKKGHKHIIWCPEEPHTLGMIAKKELGLDCVINEIPSFGMMYDVVPTRVSTDTEIEIDIKRRHSQIQVALAEIAKSLDMRTWLAVEDHGIVYNGKRITEYPFIVKDLLHERVISSFPEAIHVAKHIDCMYFNGGLPFAFEVEHTTGVTSGLSRMLQFKNSASYLNTQYVIVAPDEDREDVLTKASKEQFEDLEAMYFPYSQVEELFAFVSKRSSGIRGIKKDFLLNFMEKAS
jgi:type II restriction enzyme